LRRGEMTILEEAIATFGKDMQLTVAVEEFSELIKEICKSKRGANNRANIREEMADCYIMLEQLGIIYNITADEINQVIDEKLTRLDKRLTERNEDTYGIQRQKATLL
jgi:NTP pyrophosphatase (non-canonical NTP hydrolase)